MIDQKVLDLIIEAEREKKKNDEHLQRIPLTIYREPDVRENSEETTEKPKRGVVTFDI